MYIQDIFYDTTHLSIEEKKNLLLDAKTKSFRWWIDKHNERSIRRRIKHARFKTMLKRLDEKSHFVFIHRGGYANEQNNITMPKSLGRFRIETGFCTMGEQDGDYFLFIDLDLKHLDYFIEKYNLNKRL
jgi:hypothetical protein